MCPCTTLVSMTRTIQGHPPEGANIAGTHGTGNATVYLHRVAWSSIQPSCIFFQSIRERNFFSWFQAQYNVLYNILYYVYISGMHTYRHILHIHGCICVYMLEIQYILYKNMQNFHCRRFLSLQTTFTFIGSYDSLNHTVEQGRQGENPCLTDEEGVEEKLGICRHRTESTQQSRHVDPHFLMFSDALPKALGGLTVYRPPNFTNKHFG